MIIEYMKAKVGLAAEDQSSKSVVSVIYQSSRRTAESPEDANRSRSRLSARERFGRFAANQVFVRAENKRKRRAQIYCSHPDYYKLQKQ